MVLDNTNYLDIWSVFANEVIGDWLVAIVICFIILFIAATKYRFPPVIVEIFLVGITIMALYNIAGNMLLSLMFVLIIVIGYLIYNQIKKVYQG